MYSIKTNCLKEIFCPSVTFFCFMVHLSTFKCNNVINRSLIDVILFALETLEHLLSTPKISIFLRTKFERYKF